ncbi:MAG: hypothetical protein JWN25_3130 [Verrucomicrobiales bacterium]|nr:hypothetical protein [Verrucomicrobiales bacterium]
MVSRSLVLGYHGCDESTAFKVVNGHEDLIPSKNEYDWLGSGLYFWEDSSSRALKWAQDESRKPNGKLKTPAVLGAIIDLGNCLNLIDADHLDFVKAAHQAYLDFCRISELQPAQNKGKDLRARFLDKAVFETLHKLRQDEGETAFETVRAFFVEGEPLYEKSGLHSLDHVQICVRNSNNIVGYFLPRLKVD